MADSPARLPLGYDQDGRIRYAGDPEGPACGATIRLAPLDPGPQIAGFPTVVVRCTRPTDHSGLHQGGSLEWTTWAMEEMPPVCPGEAPPSLMEAQREIAGAMVARDAARAIAARLASELRPWAAHGLCPHYCQFCDSSCKRAHHAECPWAQARAWSTP